MLASRTTEPRGKPGLRGLVPTHPEVPGTRHLPGARAARRVVEPSTPRTGGPGALGLGGRPRVTVQGVYGGAVSPPPKYRPNRSHTRDRIPIPWIHAQAAFYGRASGTERSPGGRAARRLKGRKTPSKPGQRAWAGSAASWAKAIKADVTRAHAHTRSEHACTLM